MLDPGNAPLALALRLRNRPLVIHTDGLGWKRRKWSLLQRKYYKWSEWCSAKVAHALVSDARAMQRYYVDEYGVGSAFVPYSGAVGDPPTDEALLAHGLKPGEYYLVVARLEPENNVDLIVREYLASSAGRPLVVVGGSPYGTDYARAILDESDPRVRALGPVYESRLLNGLYANCYCYLHGHEVGGTNPSLLRAMQAGAPCVAVDVDFTREVLGEAGLFFDKAAGRLAELFSQIDDRSEEVRRCGVALRERAEREYRWDAITLAYETLFIGMIEDFAAGRRIDKKALIDVYHPHDFPRDFSSPQLTSKSVGAP